MLEESAVVAIEWAERLGNFPLPPVVRVEIAHDEADPDRRIVRVSE